MATSMRTPGLKGGSRRTMYKLDAKVKGEDAQRHHGTYEHCVAEGDEVPAVEQPG